MITKSRGSAWLAYSTAVVLTIIVLVWVMKLWEADLSVPFNSSGDGLYYGAVIKGMIDNGWYLHNDYIGMPTGLDLHDFPQHDNVLYGLIKVVSLFTRGYAETLNIYFLLSFPLTALITLLVFRHFHFSYSTSLVGSLLYTFLPYHFMRGQGHLPLSSYYLVPPMVMLIVWVFRGTPLFWKGADSGGKRRIDAGFLSLLALVICLLVSSNVYYAFFGCFFLLVAGLATASREKAVRPLATAGVLIAAIVLGFVLNLLPHFVYKFQHGKNPDPVVRNYLAPEKFGLKISQLLFPVTGHRIPFLQKGKALYNEYASYVNENDTATLGIVGSMGFLLLIAWIFIGEYFSRGSPGEPGIADLLRDFSLLNLSAVMLSVTGGFAIFVGMLATPLIRGYNRISVYIAFFSLFAVVALLDRLQKRYCASGLLRAVFSAGLVLLFAAGILDQTTDGFVPPYTVLKKELSDRTKFVRNIESALPDKAMVFQMPYIPFPDSKPLYKIMDYDHFASGYLVSSKLRWSYGAMKGREGDRWQKMASEKPLADFLAALSSAGFGGITVDRFGYADAGADIEARLTAALGEKPLVSPDGRHLFFNLAASRGTRALSRPGEKRHS